MIPKIIHLCWLSGEKYPDSIKKCLDSWHDHLPDYEIWLWDKNRFDIHSTKWTEQAYEAKKYAFAADYIRLYALYNYGGIYLDSDVLVYKSFTDLLQLPYFIGEDVVHCFEPAIIGAEPHQEWIKVVLDRYERLEFINPDGSYNMRGLPIVFHDRLVPNYRFRRVMKPIERSDFYTNVINIFPSCYFNSRDYVGAINTLESYCSHNYYGSWLKKETGLKNLIKKLTPRSIANLYFIIYYLFHKRQLKIIQIPFDKCMKSFSTDETIQKL